MGNKNCKVAFARISPNDPDDKIGEPKEVRYGCAMAGSEKYFLGNYMPNNGEYEWYGPGRACYFCGLMCPGEVLGCSSGCVYGHGLKCCATIGRKGMYQRARYNADHTMCCITSKSQIGHLTCDPKYRDPESLACLEKMEEHCKKHDNIQKGECEFFCKKRPDKCRQIIQEDLSEFTDQNALNCVNTPGLCDGKMFAYCKDEKNVNSDVCSCINNNVGNPRCFNKCVTKGYITRNMQNNPCTSEQCVVMLSIKNTGNINLKDDFKLSANCDKVKPVVKEIPLHPSLVDNILPKMIIISLITLGCLFISYIVLSNKII